MFLLNLMKSTNQNARATNWPIKTGVEKKYRLFRRSCDYFIVERGWDEEVAV
jgi:hypothetical protein